MIGKRRHFRHYIYFIAGCLKFESMPGFDRSNFSTAWYYLAAGVITRHLVTGARHGAATRLMRRAAADCWNISYWPFKLLTPQSVTHLYMPFPRPCSSRFRKDILPITIIIKISRRLFCLFNLAWHLLSPGYRYRHAASPARIIGLKRKTDGYGPQGDIIWAVPFFYAAPTALPHFPPRMYVENAAAACFRLSSNGIRKSFDIILAISLRLYYFR